MEIGSSDKEELGGIEVPLGLLTDFSEDAIYMQQALRAAVKAYALGEVPIGAVVVREGEVIARGWNQVEQLRDATAHAEMLSLTAAQEHLGDWRLEGCTLYVTKEPCPMCAGAIVHCRPDRVVVGVEDPKGGATGGWINLLDAVPHVNHSCEVTTGVLRDDCLHLVQRFFQEARAKKKEEKRLRRLEELEQLMAKEEGENE